MDSDLAQALAFDASLPAFEQQASATRIGANVGWFSPSGANNLVIFINQLKGARPWDDPDNTGRMVLDENGYPTNVPGKYVVSSLLLRSQDVAGIAPHTGRFRLYGQGIGLFSLTSSSQGTLAQKVNTAYLPSEEIGGVSYWYVDVDFEVGTEQIAKLNMLIYSLRQGEHLHALSLVHESHLKAFRAGEVFAPELIKDLQHYEALRLMDWMRANRIEEDGDGWRKEGSDWTSPNPEQRYVSPEYYTFNNIAGGAKNESRFEVSAPIEYVVELANETEADPWINLPVDVTDDRAARLGSYVAQHLDPDLVPRWEYGNELFNTSRGFEGYRYALREAHTVFKGYHEDGPVAAAEWAAYRGPHLYQILDHAFDDHGREARFVAPGWAFSGSLRPDGSLTNGYLVRYFRAEQSRKMRDGTPLPLDVVTDYSVAMYFGGTLADGRPDAAVADHVLKTVKGAEAQADTLARWILFGADEDRLARLSPAQLDTPLQMPWSETLDIGVTELIWKDIQAGLDPLTELDHVLRLQGNVLQYKGRRASRWTDVLVFDRTPSRSLAQMISATQLVGYGNQLFGEIFPGLRSGLYISEKFRLEAHADYARALGLNFVAYEGGSHVAYPVKGGFDMYEAFNEGRAGAYVLARWLQTMSQNGLSEYMHFMSHSRTNDADWWGAQAYVGQDITAAPKALVLREAAAAYDPLLKLGMTGPMTGATVLAHTSTGEVITDMPVEWAPNAAWQVARDGTATETTGTATQLKLSETLPVQGGYAYRFSFDVGLDATKATELRVVVRALGGEPTELIRWQGDVKDGARMEFDLGTLPIESRLLMIVLQRVGKDRKGGLSIGNSKLAAESF
ncbi:hypothetical protein [Celeribacter neptunius]|uniref:Carbohydrate binding domain-containing protein n=1 Tax=Celeribacter neptunius TaxID=588602 RepID=A0A1I3SF89_9RHOB|nr:hypothetical protein [Celeribacter neptunius]SFJ56652.1 hypothetical protein SAMN04487991_2425 [Celeribacter neptunius]